ncbi:MAG: hypothetical protein KAT77_04145 [Nanoarchaeota archaeon]|nr:hypothetical protein [Nanoarchaeota archaeon]
MLEIRNNGKSKKLGKFLVSFLIFFLLATALANAATTVSTQTPVTFTIPVQTPYILSYSVSPKVVINSTDVELLLDTYNAQKSWVAITLPNSSVENITLTDNVAFNYTTSLAGRYNITFYANSGDSVEISDYFIAGEGLLWNVSVYDTNLSGLSSEIQASYDSSVILTDTQTDGSYSNEIASWTYDVLFKAYNDSLQVLLSNINISADNGQSLGLDKTDLTGYLIVYAVENSNFSSFSNITLTLDYNGTSSTDENNLGLYKCADWNFTSRTCLGSFVEVSATQSKVDKTFTIETTTLSAYAIKQETEDVVSTGGYRRAECVDECSFGGIICLGSRMYQECVRIDGCDRWQRKEIDSAYMCENDEIIEIPAPAEETIKPLEAIPVEELEEQVEKEILSEIESIPTMLDTIAGYFSAAIKVDETDETVLYSKIILILITLGMLVYVLFCLLPKKRRKKKKKRIK